MLPFMPTLASEHGGKIDRLLVFEHLLIFVAVLGWFLYFVYVLFRFRKKRQPVANPEGARSHTAHVVEICVFSIEAALLIFLSIPFFTRQVTALREPGPAEVQVRVVAQQFAWTMHYPGADGVFGAARQDLVNDVANPLGLDPEDPAGKDDIVKRGVLTLPVNQSAMIFLSSKDVIHSFALPEFRVKQDAIPGMVIPIRFTPTMTTRQFQAEKNNPERQFEIMCAQLCGMGHFSMRGIVEVLEEEEFQEWLVDNAPSEEAVEYDAFFE